MSDETQEQHGREPAPTTDENEFDDELDQFINPLSAFDQLQPDTKNYRADSRRKFLDPQYLWDKCKEYFDKCDDQQLAYTIPGLAFHLGFISRQAIFHYVKRGDNCGKVIKAAKLKIEEQRNRQVVEGQGYMAGRIFDLKCNFGYNDQNPSGDGDGEGSGNNQQPQINVQNNYHGLPPQPATLEEWTASYHSLMKQKEQAQVEPPSDESEDGNVINVSPSTKEALSDND